MKSGLLYGRVLHLKVVELEEEGHVGETVEEDGLDEDCDEMEDPAPLEDGHHSRHTVQIRTWFSGELAIF
jgi:hypothetical protein